MSGAEGWDYVYLKPNETGGRCRGGMTGGGISAEVYLRRFEPFCTSKKSSKGTGLGLAVSKKIMEMHGGTIEIYNRPEGGVRVRLILRKTKE
jgi:C4-dicarboxylate-specific signal transduction histidine kinase